MIPTSYKSKLPHTLSYPVGAEALSESLKGVPQEAALSVGVYSQPILFASEFRKLRDSKSPYPILNATFRHIQPGVSASNRFIAEGWYEETWELSVYPVPRELKFVARQILLSEGLPRIKKWLSAERPPSWKHGRKHCEIYFTENDGRIIVRESGTA
jgi:hypothetical protein